MNHGRRFLTVILVLPRILIYTFVIAQCNTGLLKQWMAVGLFDLFLRDRSIDQLGGVLTVGRHFTTD